MTKRVGQRAAPGRPEMKKHAAKGSVEPADIQAEAQRSSPMSLSIHSTAPAAQAANLEPVPAVKSTSDTKSAAPSQKQAPSQAAVAPSASQDTVQISTAAQTAFRNPRKPRHRPPRKPLTATVRP